MISGHFKQHLDEIDACSVCQESLSAKNPQLLQPCGHSLCEPCVGALSSHATKDKQSLTCPECRRVVTSYSLDHEYKSLALLAGLQSKRPTHTRSERLKELIIKNAAEEKMERDKKQRLDSEKKSDRVLDKSGAVNNVVSAASPSVIFMSENDEQKMIQKAYDLLWEDAELPDSQRLQTRYHAVLQRNNIGLIALGKGLLTIAEVSHFSLYQLEFVLHNRRAGLSIIEEKLLTVDELQALSPDHIAKLISPLGLTALREKLLTFEMIHALSAMQLHILLSTNGLIALKENLLSIEQIKHLTNEQLSLHLGNIANEQARKNSQAEKNHAQAKKMDAPLNKSGAVNDAIRMAASPSVNFMQPLAERNEQEIIERGKKILANDEEMRCDRRFLTHCAKIEVDNIGLIALGKGLLTIDQVKHFSLSTLIFLFDHKRIGLTILEEKLLTVEELQSEEHCASLISPNGLVALRERLVTFEIYKELTPIQRIHLLSENGLIVLREKLLSIEQIKQLSDSELVRLLEEKAIEAARKKYQADKNEQPKKQLPNIMKNDNHENFMRFLANRKKDTPEMRDKRDKERLRAIRKNDDAPSNKSGAVDDAVSAAALPAAGLSRQSLADDAKNRDFVVNALYDSKAGSLTSLTYSFPKS